MIALTLDIADLTMAAMAAMVTALLARMYHRDATDAVGFAQAASEQELQRDVLERITLAHIFDAVEDARDLLAHWAKAMRLGPFKSDKPKSILDQAYDVLESMGAIEQRAFPLSVLQQILNEKAAKLAIDSTATRLGNSGFGGGGKK